jgi:hypothetical protein
MVEKAEGKASEAAFGGELADTLVDLLAKVNGRDVELVRARLESIKSSLCEELEGTFDHFYGGSVAKHTYVDGLSDIDCLMVINDTELEGKNPQRALEKVEGILKESLEEEAQVSHGHMAVTVEYQDGMVIQLLPALKTSGPHIHVPSRDDDWSKIDPVAFQAELTKRNQQCGGKLIPTIKLAKAIVGQLPAPQTLTGYHMESLAIAAFRDYYGERTTSAMLPVFFERAKDLVLSPIKDRSGQSIHVDEYLGPANSEERQVASHLLGRIGRRMKNATASASIAQWQALFGEDE